MEESKLPVSLQVMCHAFAPREKSALSSEGEIAYRLAFMFLGSADSNAYALFFDGGMAYRSTLKLKFKGQPTSGSVLEEIDKAILSDRRIKGFLITHNHKGALNFPSPEDIKTTDIVSAHYRDSSVKFLGHYIISEFEYMILTEQSLKISKYRNIKESTGNPND